MGVANCRVVVAVIAHIKVVAYCTPEALSSGNFRLTGIASGGKGGGSRVMEVVQYHH